MQASEYPGCCGVIIVRDFGSTSTAIHQAIYSVKEVQEFLITTEKNQRLFGKSLLLVTLNDDQRKRFGKIFKKLNWRTTSKSFHPNHKTNIYTLIKKL